MHRYVYSIGLKCEKKYECDSFLQNIAMNMNRFPRSLLRKCKSYCKLRARIAQCDKKKLGNNRILISLLLILCLVAIYNFCQNKRNSSYQIETESFYETEENDNLTSSYNTTEKSYRVVL